MYKSPLEVVYDKAVYKNLKDEENNMMLVIQQAIGYKIDKDELIKALQYDRNQYEQGLKDGMGQPKWIPCSKRLPKNSGNYLIVIEDSIYPYIQYYRISWFYSGNKEWSYKNATVLAWMPLPEPYKEAEDEADD